MKIRNISCTRFAGVRDRNISFEDGINLIYGKNESGKSTLVNLISRTLFQNAHIGEKTVSDKEFSKLYFPGVRKDSSRVGDFADGTITFETENGIYTLTKEWGSGSGCTLLTPDGEGFHDQKTINDILKDVLLYGEGVYADMLFSSQRNTDISLQTILDAAKKTEAKQEIVDAVSRAFVESDGISLDVIEQAINTKIDEIAGKHWDFDREKPKPKAGRWDKGLGEILKAYYALEHAKEVLKKISDLEVKVDYASNDYIAQDSEVRIAEDEYSRFIRFSSQLEVQNERKMNIDRLEKELRKTTDVLNTWPKLVKALEEAEALKIEKDNRELIDKYENAKEVVDELKELDDEIVNASCPTDGEIVQVKTAQSNVMALENKLCGMNLDAVIKMFGDNTVEVKTLRTGEVIDKTSESISITEAVSITVPNVMEMQLSPANVNVDEIENKIAEQKEIIDVILKKHNVCTVIELEQFAKRFSDAKAKAENVNSRLELLLGDANSFEELETAVKAIIVNVRVKEEIEKDINTLCGDNDVASFVASKRTIINGYINDYGSISELKAHAYDIENNLKKVKESVAAIEDIPVDYLNITDPKSHLEALQKDFKEKQDIREKALTAKTAATRDLENYKENISGDPVAEAEKAERIFEEQKMLLAHWQHIAEVFKVQKENIHDNPMQDIADRFTHYLGVISGGKVSSEFPEEDKLNINIYSDNHLVDYGKLSEGTKDTVSLAFRLAVLDHLFPEGGGIIVFDDPFTDMDAERTAQSCELIKECATRHQVIFLTCKEDYLDMLGGNKILV